MPAEPLRVWVHRLPTIDFRDRLQRVSLAPMVRPVVEAAQGEAIQAPESAAVRTWYRFTDSPADAEVAVLPQVHEVSDRPQMDEAVARAEEHGLRTLVFSRDDREPVLPWRSAILLHPGPTRGAQPHARALALPPLIADRTRWPEPRPDGPRPSVAFCGQGAARPPAAAYQWARRAVSRWRDRLRPGGPEVVPPPREGHVRLRAAALRNLTGHPGVDARFVIRDRYLAGASTEEERLRSQIEFDDNLRSATYALCVRGTGNYSTRFYEALSFGRVPLLVDSGGILPFEDRIDWSSHVVCVEADAVGRIGDALVAAHPDVLADPRRSAEGLHALWQDWLTEDAVFGHLPETIRRLLRT